MPRGFLVAQLDTVFASQVQHPGSETLFFFARIGHKKGFRRQMRYVKNSFSSEVKQSPSLCRKAQRNQRLNRQPSSEGESEVKPRAGENKDWKATRPEKNCRHELANY